MPSALCRSLRTQRAVIPHNRSAAFVPVEGALMQWPNRTVVVSGAKNRTCGGADLSSDYLLLRSNHGSQQPRHHWRHCIDDAPGPRWTTSALHVRRATLSLESSFSQAPHVCTHCGILWKIRQAIASASTSRRLCYWLLTTTPQAHHQYTLVT